MPRPRSEPTGSPGQSAHPGAPSPWAPQAPTEPGTSQPPDAPPDYTPAPGWTPAEEDNEDEEEPEDEVWPHQPAAAWPPQRIPTQRQPYEPPPVQPPPVRPPERRSSATAWWIAIGIIVVALAVAAGVLVGLNLARRGAGAHGAACNDRPVLRTTAPVVERAAKDIGTEIGGCSRVRITPPGPARTQAELPE
ncbi:hypothetical protein [Dactylosporangium fulvum]|uniref:Uncharacterized protein n=1 Tax=Dactylosporangium fulvum TaxID=53359 RepID=A0ABY5W3M7_9ACTN|nr:hypothetical protein [Dactylosporangium fulvum]UWP83839.1 hypothetical protein Dfulv_06150 [Dactylosporangium fulvum]